MQEPKSIPLPIALRELIISNNELLKIYQRELTQRVQAANKEMLQILGINEEEGWQIDIESMSYIYNPPQNDSSIS
jgi:hypothetical protein